MDLLCAECLLRQVTDPGPSVHAAVTIHEGTALCRAHAYDRVAARS